MIRIAALIGGRAAARLPLEEPTTVSLGPGVSGTFGVLRAPDADTVALGPHEVRLRVLAFSCNYRDRARLALEARTARADRITPFGSEFCAVVERTGSRVRHLACGQRVIGDNALSFRPAAGTARGIPTNDASLECLHLDARRVMPVPDALPTPEAAAFSLAAQTAVAMVRRARLAAGQRCLVLSGRSVTSLVALQVARARGARVTVATSRTPSAAEQAAWHALGAEAVIDRAEPVPAAAETGGYDVAIDPFHDLHLDWVASHVRLGGQVVTCGFATQGIEDAATVAARAECVRRGLQLAMARNITVHGHCLGARRDLQTALRLQADRTLSVPLAAVHSAGAFPQFVHDALVARPRWGKVVFRYG